MPRRQTELRPDGFVYIFVLSKEGWGNKCLRSNVTAYIDDLDGRNELLFSSSFFTRCLNHATSSHVVEGAFTFNRSTRRTLERRLVRSPSELVLQYEGLELV